MVFQNNLLMGAASTISTGPFTIDYSCRFNPSDSAYLTRTPGSDGDLKKFTINVWVKRCGFGANTYILKTTNSGYSGWLGFGGTAVDRITWAMESSTAGAAMNYNPDIKYRDPSAWYNLHMIWDTAQSSANDRAKVFINGVQHSSTLTTAPNQNSDSMQFNKAIAHEIARYGSAYFDGYLAQYCFIDGSALAATSFGEFDDYGIWRPIDPSDLTFGTNGFYLDFADSSDLGNDVSGNNNDFTSSGLATNDQVTDTPTNNHMNFASLARGGDADHIATISDGGLTTTKSTDKHAGPVTGTAIGGSGKWYCEGKVTNVTGAKIGICTTTSDWLWDTIENTLGYYSTAWSLAISDGNKWNNNTSTSYGSAVSADDVVQMAIDLDNGKIWWGVNGTFIASGDPAAGSNEAFSNLTTTDDYFIAASIQNGGAIEWNFGQLSFAHTPPTGFNKINTANLSTPTILDGTAHFQPTLYTGTGSSNEVNQSGNSTFQPDFVWIKNRDTTDTNVLTNSVTGATKYNASDSVIALTTNTETLKSFDSDGFTVGTDAIVNTNTEDYVGWSWKGDSSSGVLNEEGSIDSYIAANTTAGFSVVKWTGTGSNGTLGHGLTSAPEFIMGRYSNSTGWWHGWHVDLAGATSVFFFNASSAASTDASAWNSTIPTSTLISVGSQLSVNQSGTTCMQYAWHSVDGYSKISSYTGNGLADGAYVFTGFKPAYVMIKSIGSGSWFIYDSARSPYNEIDDQLLADSNAAETTGSEEIDFLANGFKCRTADGGINTNNTTYLFSAFAEYPFGGGSDVTPATAF